MQPIATPVTTLMIVFLLLGLSACSNKQREEGRARLTEQAAEQIQAAEQKMNEYDFHAARKLLYEVREEIQGSSYADVATEDKLFADIDAAYAAISDKESDFHRKKLKGWSVIDGRLVSPADQPRALAEKKRRQEQDAKRKAEERRMAQARAKAEAEAREKEKRRPRDAARVAEATRFLSQKGLGFGSINPVGDGELLVGWKHSTVYISANAADLLIYEPSYGSFFVTAFREASGQFAEPAAWSFRVNGRPEKVAFHCDDENIVRVHNDGSARFKNPGRTNVRVTLAGNAVAVPITVIQLPFRSGQWEFVDRSGQWEFVVASLVGSTPAADVIRVIGFPDEKKKHYISWPDSEIIDRIYYGSSDPRWSIATEHWKFNKYPGAVIAIVANRVYAVSTYAERQEPQVFLP